MKTNYFLTMFAAVGLMFLGTLQSSAADYTISFTGTGASTTVGSVEVQNLTQGTSIVVPEGSTLTLVDWPTGLDQLIGENEGISIFSNPAEGNSSVSFYSKQAGNTQINAFSIDGRKVIGETRNLQEGLNSYQLSLPTGIYLINVRGEGFEYSAKMISPANSTGINEITFLGNEAMKTSSKLKSANATIMMNIVDGDTLLYKGISGNFATLVVDVATASKTVNFEFVACVDATGNNYPVVKIGTQTWMAENLRTDKYNSGAPIPNENDSLVWGNVAYVTGAWVYLDKNPANDLRLGKLYNWFAVNDERGITPAGWHVPSIEEFGTLQVFLGGVDVAGSPLKERGDANWVTGSNTDGTNHSGFSARAGAKRNSSGMMNDYDYCYMWSTTVSIADATKAFCAYPKGNATTFSLDYSTSFRNGFSVRCVKD